MRREKAGTSNTEHSTWYIEAKAREACPQIQDDHGLSVIGGRSEFVGEWGMKFLELTTTWRLTTHLKPSKNHLLWRGARAFQPASNLRPLASHLHQHAQQPGPCCGQECPRPEKRVTAAMDTLSMNQTAAVSSSTSRSAPAMRNCCGWSSTQPPSDGALIRFRDSKREGTFGEFPPQRSRPG
jgi:hypothetical protein